MDDSQNSAVSGRGGPFGALLAAAARDPAAARGLAAAYSSLDVSARRKIVDAVVSDARAEGFSVSPALVPLLAVEEDTQIAQAIADAIGRDGGIGLESLVGPRALVAGDDEAGGVLLIRPLHGTFVEVLGLAWTRESGVSHTTFEPMVHDAAAAQQVAHLPAGLRFEETPMRFAIDRIAPILWTHRRLHGSLPHGVERFAELFSIDAEIDE